MEDINRLFKGLLKVHEPVLSQQKKKDFTYFLTTQYKIVTTVIEEQFSRSIHWHLWLKASGALGQILSNPGYYESLCNQPMNYPNPDFTQIRLDVDRSYSSVKDRAMRAKKEQNLTNVLNTFIKRNAKVGYL